jgi:hypothetical protein
MINNYKETAPLQTHGFGSYSLVKEFTEREDRRKQRFIRTPLK